MTEAMPSTASSHQPLLSVRNLTVEFAGGWNRRALRAVDDVSFDIGAQETLGLVGESGSGKTTIGRAVLGLVPVTAGSVSFDGRDITDASYRVRRMLSSELQVIFQDPYSSLNPTRTVGQTLSETLRAQGERERNLIDARTEAMLERVGLPPDACYRYPANFSGGQRQRIAIARALMVDPRLVVCDEPLSALDLSVQAQVLNLLRQLQDELKLSYLFIAHDLTVVRYLSHRIVVLYRGRVMESGEAREVSDRPVHPYTQALLAAAPVPDPEIQRLRRRPVPVRPADAAADSPVSACPFAPRCPYAIDICREVRPTLEMTSAGSLVACHRWREVGSLCPTASESETNCGSGSAGCSLCKRVLRDAWKRTGRVADLLKTEWHDQQARGGTSGSCARLESGGAQIHAGSGDQGALLDKRRCRRTPRLR